MKTALVYASQRTSRKYRKSCESNSRKASWSWTESYIKTAEELIKSNDASFAGYYSCSGYDTWGPFKLIGGKNKNHPDENDIEKAIQFYENLI